MKGTRLMRNICALVVLTFITLGCSVYRPKSSIPNGDYTKQMLKDVSEPDLLKNYKRCQKARMPIRQRRSPEETRFSTSLSGSSIGNTIPSKTIFIAHKQPSILPGTPRTSDSLRPQP